MSFLSSKSSHEKMLLYGWLGFLFGLIGTAFTWKSPGHLLVGVTQATLAYTAVRFWHEAPKQHLVVARAGLFLVFSFLYFLIVMAADVGLADHEDSFYPERFLAQIFFIATMVCLRNFF